MIVLAAVVLLAQTPIATPEKRGEEITRRLADYREQIAKADEKEAKILELLNQTEQDIFDISTGLAQLQRDVESAKTKMQEDEAAIAALDAKIGKRKRWLAGRLRSLYIHGRPGYLKILFASESYADLLRRSKYQSIVSQHDADMVSALKSDVALIATRRANFGEHLASLESMKATSEEDVEELEAQRAVRRGLLEDVQSERADLGKIARLLERRLEKEIGKLPTSSAVFVPKPFEGAKGKILAPLAEAKVARPYGNYKHPTHGIEMKQQGVKYAVPLDTPVYSIWDGKVEMAKWLSSYGQVVIIDHGSGWRSLYAHVGRVEKEVGDFVKEGDVIALSGETASLEGPELFFAIYHEGKPVDPAEWLIKEREK